MDIKRILSQIDNISESAMKAAEKKSTGPQFVGKWKGTDSADKAKNKLVGSNESILKDLSSALSARPERDVKNELIREFQEFKNAGINKPDSIKVDVPLLIRLLEYAREDANTDMDLHNVAEKLIQMSETGQTLTMDQYEDIVGQLDEYGGTTGYGAASQAPQGTNTSTDLNDPAVKQAKLDQAQIKKSTQNIAGTLNQQGAAQPLNTVKFQDVMNKLDSAPNTSLSNQEQNQLGPLAVAASKIVQNPQTASQFKTLVTKADSAEQAKQAKVQQAQKQVGTNTPAAGQTQTTPAGQIK